jgi:hypothetical protein
MLRWLRQVIGRRARARERYRIDLRGLTLPLRRTEHRCSIQMGVPVEVAEGTPGMMVAADGTEVSPGMAWWYQAYSREQTLQEREQYELAQTQAHGKGSGLWGDKRATAPWEWRKEQRTASSH